MKKYTKLVHHTVQIGFAAFAGLLGMVLCAPSAFAYVVRPHSAGSSTSASSPAPLAVHSAVVGGMAGWQIALIAIGAAMVAAVLAVLADRARVGHHQQGNRRLGATV